jgi:translation initiation factor IF-2
MLSLRSTVIALVASAVLVLILAGVASGVFTTHSPPPPVGQSVSVHQDGAAPAPTVPVPPDIAAPAAPLPAAPLPAAPLPAAPLPAAPLPAAPAPAAPAPLPAAPAPAPAAAPSEPLTHYRQAPAQRQPTAVAQPPVSVAPAQDQRPASPRPPSALPAHEAKSRTVNTEPCACDGRMRRVSTHWDPPQG